MNLELFNRYWSQWNERERLLVILASICIIFYLFYAVLFAPLNIALKNSRTQLSSDEATLQWMRQIHRQYKETATPQTLSSGQLLTLLGQQLSTTAFHQYTYQLEQTGSGDIQLSFETVPYNVFLLWFKKFNTQYALTIKQFSAERAQAPGTVKLLVVMAAS